MTEDSAVKVCVRVRPLAEREENAAENAQLYWKADNNSVHQIDGASVKSFSFDRVFTAHETTNQLYQTIAKPLVVSTVQGYNGTIFAYGQTSSGKTFSMMGCDKNPGVIPLAVEDIFQTIQTCSSKEFLLRVSYMEIYNETVSDLLVDSWKRKPLEVREALNKNIYVADLSEELVTSTAQALHWIRFGEKNRHYGKTKMNERSSRSHTIFRMILESREKSDCENSDGAIIVSHLNLVDLAGSERASQTGAEGARFKEGCNINKSLFTLGQVIKKLTDESHKGYTSYRDSKLTRILQNSLGGNAKTVIICTITPAAFDETLSTLQFASTAKKMKNDPHVTEVSDDGALLKRYRNEIVDLKRRLQEVSSVTQSTATEKELLSQLQEKDQLQREQEDRIRNLTNLLVSSNPNPAPVRQAPKRRMTWGGKMLRLAATSSASSEAVLSEMAKRRRVNVSCIEPYQEFYPPWDAFEELPEDMDATQTSITTRSFGDSPKESASGEQLRDLSEKMAALEQQLEIESCEKSAAESKAKALVDRVTELEQQLEAQQREAKLEEAQQREAKLEEAQQREAKLEEAQQREAKLEEAQTDENQMRRQFSEAIQLCESLSSEKDLLLVERDYLKEELGLSLEQIQTLEKEKSSLCKKLEEKQETDEFEMLEAQIRKDDELEQREEISLLKLVIDSSEQKCLELQTEMEMLSLQLKKKCDFIEELQAMNGKDLVQEVTLLQRSLGDAEKISMDTKKDWACLRSQNMDLKEKNGTLTLNAESHEHELASLRSQLEREKSKFKKMQFDLQKELNIAFEENVKLGSLLDGKVPKNLIDNVDLERTVTKLNKDLTACLENNTELHVQLEELQQLPDKMAELSKQLEESECVRKSLTEELQEIHTLKRELEEKVSNCEETRKTDEDIQKELEEQLEQAASELQNAQATNEAAMLEWESRLQSLCEERDALQQRMEQVPEAGSLVLSLQEQLEEEMQKLSSEEALHQQRVSELNQQMQTVSQELVSLQQERDHSFSSLAALTEERDQLKADLQENIEMMIELQDELRITQEKIRSQKECIQKLEAQTAEESAPDQPEKHEAQIRTLKVELQHLQEHKKSSSDELQTLESRVRGLSEDKDQLQQTLAALTQQKQQLQQVLDSSTDSLQTQITELEQTLHMVSEQKKSLEEQLQNHLETSSQKEDLLSSVQEKLKEQEEINTRLCEEHSVLKQQVQSLEANCSSDELQTLESRVRGLSEDKDQLQQTLAALTQQKQQLQQVLDSSTDSLQTQITELEQTLHMVSEQKKSLEEQLQNHLQTITELEQTLHMVSEQKKSLEEQLQNHLETSSQKEDLLSSVQEKLKEQEEINTRLCEEHSVLKQQVQSLEANCSSDELQTLESRVRGLSEDKDQLQQTLAALTQQKQQLQQVLDSSTDSLQTQITELEQTLHMVSEQKKSLEEQLQNHLETSSQKEDLLSSVQEKLKEQEEINTRLCEEHSVLKQQSEALTEEVQLLRRKEETEVPALQQELSDANRTISKLREQPPSEENPEHQLSLLLHDSNTHFQKSLQDLQSMVERRLVPMQRKTLVFMAPAGFSSLPKNMVDSFRAVNFLTVRSVNAMITIQEQLMKYAQRFLQLFEELMKTDLAVFEERRLQDVLLSIRQAPSLCITDMDFMDLWRRRLQEVVHKREQYLTKIDSTMKNINGFYGDLLNAELEGKDRFETQLSEICRKEPVDLSALDVFFGTEQQQRNDYIQERDAIFKDFSKDQDESLKQLSEQVAQEKALLEDERSKRFTLQHGLESAPLKSEASLLNDNQRLLHQLHTTQDLLKILSAEKEELQKAQVKAEHLVASHKEATQLLQTELQDTCAKLQEKEEEVEELQTSLQQSQSEWNSSAKAVEVETLNLKVSKLETESQNYRHEIQKLTSLLEAKETTLRRLKETLRSKQEEESMLEGEALHARLVRPKGLVQSSVVLEKSRLDEEAKHLKLRITELESLVSSLQAEVGKWKQRALKMKSVTEAKPKQNQETSSQKRLQFDSPRKLLGSPRKVLESPAQINSPKSRIFDGGSHSEFLLKKCPKQFFDNSSLGAAPGAEGRAEKEDWLQWPLSPNEEMCKKQ